jgi:hypothetical protein
MFGEFSFGRLGTTSWHHAYALSWSFLILKHHTCTRTCTSLQASRLGNTRFPFPFLIAEMFQGASSSKALSGRVSETRNQSPIALITAPPASDRGGDMQSIHALRFGQ